MDTPKIVVQCDHCKADMDLVTGRNCFSERYRRYECRHCGNAHEEALVRAAARPARQAA